QAGAEFYSPQLGYHSTLVRPDPNGAPGTFDFYTKSHTRYHFEFDPNVSLSGKVYTLRYIEDTNGNQIELYYANTDPRFASLPSDLQNRFDADSGTLDFVKEKGPNGRALLL